jgi:hypothetical protein
LPIATIVFLLQNGNALKSRPAAIRLKEDSSSGGGLVFAELATAKRQKMSAKCSREGNPCDTWRAYGGKNGLKITALPADLQRPGLMVAARRHGRVNCLDTEGDAVVRCYHQWVLGSDVESVKDLKKLGRSSQALYHVLPYRPKGHSRVRGSFAAGPPP